MNSKTGFFLCTFVTVVFTVLLSFSIVSWSKQRREEKVEKEKLEAVCLDGYLYYDWQDRPQFLCIPVIDEEGKAVPCVEEE